MFSISSTSRFNHICLRCFSQVRKAHQKSVFRIIDSNVESSSESFQTNFAHSKSVEKRFKDILAIALAGGGEKAIARHTKMNKKLMVEDRLKLLLDEDADFLEFSHLAGMQMQYGNVARASMITGI